MGGSAGGEGGSAGSEGGSAGGEGGSSGQGPYSGQADGMPDMPVGTGVSAEELEKILNESMGDYDGQMEREQEVLASSGGGSAKSAGQRESGDAAAVSGGGGGGGAMGGMAGLPSESDSGSSQGGSNSDAGAGGGGAGTSMDSREGVGDADQSDRDSAMVVDIPEDIPADGSGDDQIGRQIREMAMAEENPELRERYWDEYRKHMGIK
jgi:hypothetical protein